MSNNPKLPNFLIVGAAKCGTTSIFIYLKQHPDIYLPIFKYKEPKFFTSNININLAHRKHKHRIFYDETRIDNLDDYISIFKDVNQEKAIGEATTAYLYFYETTIPEIKKLLGDPKIIIFLRNPVDRAFSSYKHLLKDRDENRSFEECLDLEDERKKENWPVLFMLKDAGLYYKQVKAYLENFSRVKVIIYDDLIKNQESEIREILEFLEVNSLVKIDTETKHNVSNVPKNYFINSLLKRKNPLKSLLRPVMLNLLGEEKTGDLFNFFIRINSKKVEMKPETRKMLIDFFHSDIIKLQELIKRDLSSWIS